MWCLVKCITSIFNKTFYLPEIVKLWTMRSGELLETNKNKIQLDVPLNSIRFDIGITFGILYSTNII